MKFTEEQLNGLRLSLRDIMSEKRYNHTVEVEKMSARLAELFCPDKTDVLRAAALLHDTTKEYSLEEQLQICGKFGIITKCADVLAPKTFHARTAAALIPVNYPDFADSGVIDAVRWHTTGRENMTLVETLIYFADYIDESRKFEDCVVLRRFFWGADPAAMTDGERTELLYTAMVMSFDMTMKGLIDEQVPISEDTILARNDFICRLAKLRKKPEGK